MLRLKRNLIFIFSVLFVATLIFGAVNWQTNRAQTKNYEEEYQQAIRNALAEIDFPAANTAPGINSAAENLSNFMSYRAGVSLSQANKDLLRELEQKSWNQSKRINRGPLAGILTDLAIEKISNATDEDINYAAEKLSGFDAPDLPESFKRGKRTVMFRASGAGSIEKDEFIEQAKILRDTVKSNKIARSFVSSAIDRELEQRAVLLAKASPKDFDSTTDFTPGQAVLITYAIVTDDVPMNNKKALQKKMEDLQTGISRINNQPYPSPQGHTAYGVNGYLFSTPVNLLLDDAAFSKILNGIKEKSGIR